MLLYILFAEREKILEHIKKKKIKVEKKTLSTIRSQWDQYDDKSVVVATMSR